MEELSHKEKCEYCSSMANYSDSCQFGKYLCCKHYKQFKRNGKIYYTNRDPNYIIIHEDFAEIFIRSKKYGDVKVAIDLEDINLIYSYTWSLSGDKRPESRSTGELISLSRLLLPKKENLVVDHIDRNPLNNRRSNLRYITHSKNIFNRNLLKNNKSGYPGISWSKLHNKWTCKIEFQKKVMHLGLFEDKEEAIKVRQAAEIKHFGEVSQKI